jgi:hypothetical protein
VLGVIETSNKKEVLGGALYKMLINSVLVEGLVNPIEIAKGVTRVNHYRLGEHHIYGSSRLGIQKYHRDMISYNPKDTLNPKMLPMRKVWYSLYAGDFFSPLLYHSDTLNRIDIKTGRLEHSGEKMTHILGRRHYELTNHLGNVQATVLDRTTPVIQSNQLKGYKSDISLAHDYYPFGIYE